MMKNIRFHTIAVLFANLPTSKGNRCLHVDMRFSTFDIGSHVISYVCTYIVFGIIMVLFGIFSFLFRVFLVFIATLNIYYIMAQCLICREI